MREDEIIVRGKHGSEEVGFQPFLETQKMINVHHMYNRVQHPSHMEWPYSVWAHSIAPLKKIIFHAGRGFSGHGENWSFPAGRGVAGIYLETNPNPRKSRKS
jgi:hypothetical protein